MRAAACTWLLALFGLPALAATPADTAAGNRERITLSCEAVYLPARSTWTREVSFAVDNQRIRSLLIDGVPVYTFTVYETVVMTALDNERIQLDTATLTWRSDFRGQATSEGRCEKK